MADIFISYTSSDRDWAFWIAKELEALDDTPRVHEWEVERGADIYAWMEVRHDAADHVLCVISDEYLKETNFYSQLERRAALWQAAGKRPNFVLLVSVKPCTLPTLSDHYRRCELFGVPEGAARQRFREFMRKREAPAVIAFPGKMFAVSNVPDRVPEHFMGRDGALAEIERALGRYEGRVAVTALHGLPGIGKTTLAAAYAEKHRADYRATWWIQAYSGLSMRADLVGLGVQLHWVALDEEGDPAFAAVMERLRHEGEGILLIYDNAPDADSLQPYLPRGGAAQVIITSNSQVWRRMAEPIEIRLWPKEIGADYLIARTGHEAERAAAEELSAALKGLPLAHEQAAAYCERLEVPLDEYHRRFDAEPVRLLDIERDAPAEYHDHLTVAKTFALAIDKAAKMHPAAEPLIVHAALLAPEPIPLFLFAEGRDEFPDPLAAALAVNGLDEAVAALRAFALIDREAILDERDARIKTDTIRLHTLVRHCAASRRSGQELEGVRRSLIGALAATYPAWVFEDPRTWPRARRLDGLAFALVGGDAALPAGIELKASELLNKLGGYRTGVLTSFAPGRALVERSLAIREKLLGADHPDNVVTLNNLAELAMAQEDPGEAAILLQRAWTICENNADHPETAETLNIIAHLMMNRGEVDEAQSLWERALIIQENTLGPDHPSISRTLSGLALVFRKQGDLSAAQRLFERVVAMDEKAFGPDHPRIAIGLNNLAMLLEDRGDLVTARRHCERSLAIHEKVLGPEHPAVAKSLSNLAHLLSAQGDFMAAKGLYERALPIYETSLGPDHPAAVSVRHDLAVLARQTGR